MGGDGLKLCRPGKKSPCDDHKNSENTPLRAQKSLCTAGNVASELDHVGVSRILLADPNGLKNHDHEA